MLNKLNQVYRKVAKSQDPQAQAQVKDCLELMDRVAMALCDQARNLDVSSILHTLKVCAYQDKLKYRPSRESLAQFEDKVMTELPQFLKADISVVACSFLKLNYYPQAIFHELAQMQKLTILRADGCLRMLELLSRHAHENDRTELTMGLIEKLLE